MKKEINEEFGNCCFCAESFCEIDNNSRVEYFFDFMSTTVCKISLSLKQRDDLLKRFQTNPTEKISNRIMNEKSLFLLQWFSWGDRIYCDRTPILVTSILFLRKEIYFIYVKGKLFLEQISNSCAWESIPWSIIIVF